MKKFLLLAAAVSVAAVATVPLWGGCDLNQRLCDTWCAVRHGDSDIQAAACRTRCASEKAGCVAGEGAEALGRLLKGGRK